MDITLNSKEIESALIDYISDAISLEGKTLEVTMVAGRGANGHSAIISINKTTETTATSGSSTTPNVTAPDFGNTPTKEEPTQEEEVVTEEKTEVPEVEEEVKVEEEEVSPAKPLFG